MPPKRKIPANEFADDIRSGMSNDALMQKYRLSIEGLASVFKKLLEANILDKSELNRRMAAGDDTADLDQMRNLARCYPIVNIPVIDLADRRGQGYLRDLTEKGLQVAGIRARVNEMKNLLIKADAVSDLLPFTLEACCKWCQEQDAEGVPVSGFEIKSLSRSDRVMLRKTLELFTLCDEAKIVK